MTVQRPVPFWPAASTTTSTNGLPVFASTWPRTSAEISIRKEARSPLFHSAKIFACSAGSIPAPERSRSKASPMTCMSAYSMPLWTILTKWPAPSVPIQAQQGLPSTWAAIFSSSGPRAS